MSVKYLFSGSGNLFIRLKHSRVVRHIHVRYRLCRKEETKKIKFKVKKLLNKWRPVRQKFNHKGRRNCRWRVTTFMPLFNNRIYVQGFFFWWGEQTCLYTDSSEGLPRSGTSYKSQGYWEPILSQVWDS